MSDRITVTAAGEASAERVWALLAHPSCWPAWAPHMAHVSDPVDPGSPPSVHVGQHLRVHSIIPKVAVPVEVTEVEPGVSWTMQARLPFGAIRSSHTVSRALDITTVSVQLRWTGPRAVGIALLAGYRPVAAWSVRRLLALAEAEAQGAAANARRMCGQPPA